MAKAKTYPPEERGCVSCGESDEKCPKSKSTCGHHCNHSWSHDECCWCEKTWGEESGNSTHEQGETR